MCKMLNFFHLPESCPPPVWASRVVAFEEVKTAPPSPASHSQRVPTPSDLFWTEQEYISYLLTVH